MAVYEISELFARYGRKSRRSSFFSDGSPEPGWVLRNLNLEILPGTITSVIGPNGCGKSTLLKCLSRQLVPEKGEIRLDGILLEQIPLTGFARRVSYVKQSQDMDIPALSVEDLVLHGRFPHLPFPRRFTPKDREIALEAMKRMDILPLRRVLLKNLSGGQRQKAWLAMTLAQGTDILLMDEPTTYLDVKHQLEILSLLSGLKKQGKTIVTVLHDINGALKISDKICLLHEGSLLFSGPPKELLDSGKLETAFGVRPCQVSTPEGVQLFFQQTQGTKME